MYLPGNITISRIHCSKSDDYVEVTVNDDASGCEVVSIKCSLLAFAEALMAHGYRPCEFELRAKHIGKVRELREIIVPRPDGYVASDKQHNNGMRWIKKHAKQELVDGWEPHHPSEVFNHHRWIGDGKSVRVTLIRFVEPKAAKAE